MSQELEVETSHEHYTVSPLNCVWHKIAYLTGFSQLVDARPARITRPTPDALRIEPSVGLVWLGAIRALWRELSSVKPQRTCQIRCVRVIDPGELAPQQPMADICFACANSSDTGPLDACDTTRQ